MSKRTRTISWMEGKIIEVLSKKRVITTHLALSACVFSSNGVRNVLEQSNFEIGLQYLISKKIVTKEKDQDGFTVYKLAA